MVHVARQHAIPVPVGFLPAVPRNGLTPFCYHIHYWAFVPTYRPIPEHQAVPESTEKLSLFACGKQLRRFARSPVLSGIPDSL
jgi:hypothetical protein